MAGGRGCRMKRRVVVERKGSNIYWEGRDMDIYLTGHLALAFGIFARNLPINPSFIQNQSNQFIHLYNPSFFLSSV